MKLLITIPCDDSDLKFLHISLGLLSLCQPEIPVLFHVVKNGDFEKIEKYCESCLNINVSDSMIESVRKEKPTHHIHMHPDVFIYNKKWFEQLMPRFQHEYPVMMGPAPFVSIDGFVFYKSTELIIVNSKIFDYDKFSLENGYENYWMNSYKDLQSKGMKVMGGVFSTTYSHFENCSEDRRGK
jgi:hypothetical protein